MGVEIKPMETDGEIRGKAYVHWRSWHEAYRGVVSDAYLDGITLAKCEAAAYQWPDNILVAKDGERVVGFVGYGESAGQDDGAGEIYALYILSEYYGTGLGKRLMDAALERLGARGQVFLWVLRDNARAISFYKKCGFRTEGEEKYLEALGAAETRMVKRTDIRQQ